MERRRKIRYNSGMKKIVGVVLSVLFLGAAVFAEPVTSLKVEGLKKTKDEYMQNLLKEYIGKDSEEINLKEIETRLQAEGLFSEIDVKVEAPELVVTVKEKITFIPLPFAMYSSDSGFMGGFMLMNMNAFGKKHMLVTGGVFSGDRQTGMLIYSKPAGDIQHPGYSVFTSFAHKSEKVTDFGNNKYFEVDNLMGRGRFSINENLNKYVSVSTGVDYSYQHFFRDSLSDDHEITVRSGVSLNHVNWNGYYLISNYLSLDGDVGYSSMDSDLIEAVRFNAMAQYAFVPRVRAILTAAGTLETGRFLLNKSDRGNIGSTIMYKNFKADQLAGTGFALEEAICKMKFGTVSLFETYEFDMGKDIFDDSFVYCHGPGAGVKLYIKQLAFPAMNLGFSYNVTQDDWKFVASFGVSM